MNTDVDRTRLLPMPMTGEALDLAGPDADLATALDQIRQLEHELRSAKRAVSDELLARMDRERLWTLPAGDYTLVGESEDAATKYDPDRLRGVLDALVGDGVITDAAADRACEPVVKYVPRKRGIDAVIKLGSEVAERVRACAERRPRRITVKPERQS